MFVVKSKYSLTLSQNTSTVEHILHDRIVDIRRLLHIDFDFEVDGNKVITTCEKTNNPDLQIIIKVNWGQPGNGLWSPETSHEEQFYCPCE